MAELSTVLPLIKRYGLSHLRARAVNSPAWWSLPSGEQQAARYRLAGPVGDWTRSDLALVRSGVENG